ncbi:MAG: hypothetical protein QXU93_05170 [Thermoproteus sp.]
MAILSYGFNCTIPGNITRTYTVDIPTGSISISLIDLASSYCYGEPTRITKLSLSVLVLGRFDNLPKWYKAIDLLGELKSVGYSDIITPESRLVKFTVEKVIVDKDRWVSYLLKSYYGQYFGEIDVVAWSNFSSAFAIRVSYTPFYYWLTKYLDVKLYVNGTTFDLNNGDAILPLYAPIYGNISMYLVLTALKFSTKIYVNNDTGPIRLVPMEVVRRGLEGNITSFEKIGKNAYRVIISLNDTIDPASTTFKLVPSTGSVQVMYFARVVGPRTVELYLFPYRPGALFGELYISMDRIVIRKEGAVRLELSFDEGYEPEAVYTPLSVQRYAPSATDVSKILEIHVVNVNSTEFLYVYLNMTATPRDPHKPVLIVPIVLYETYYGPMIYDVINATGVTPIAVAQNKSTGITLLVPLYLMESPQEVDLLIYAENIRSYKILDLEAYAYAFPDYDGSVIPYLSAVSLALIALAFSLARKRPGEGP